MLLLLPLLAPVHAGTSPIDARIASPAPDRSFVRGEPIAFVDGTTTSSDCPIVEWVWKFDDGHKAEGREVAHAYEESGEYAPSLHVRGACGHRHGVTLRLVVTNAPPRAHLALPDGAIAGAPFRLDASGSSDPDGDLESYQLTIDAEALAEQEAPSWTLQLSKAGAHEAKLTVTDEDGASATATLGFQVAPAPLSSIVIAGPDRVPAGNTVEYGLSGSDRYGNAVALAQEALVYEAPTRAGEAVVEYEEKGVLGALPILVVAGPLARLALDGPASAPAGSWIHHDVRAWDAFDNARAPRVPGVGTQARALVGEQTICHEEDGVQACAVVAIRASDLADIAIEGPGEVVAGEAVTFGLAGFDAYGNVVPLARSTLAWTAPTLAGMVRVTYSEGGIDEARDVRVIPGALARLLIEGPARVEAGSTTEYALRGSDAYGNEVLLAEHRLKFDAPPTIGTTTLAYREADAFAEILVEVVAGPPARIWLEGPTTIPAGSTTKYVARGEDRFGNPVVFQDPAFEYAAPTLAGPALACHEREGLSGCLDVLIVAGPLAIIAIEGPTALRVAQSATFRLRGSDRYGNPAPLSTPQLEVQAPTRAGPFLVTHAEQDAAASLNVLAKPGPTARAELDGPRAAPAGSVLTYRVRAWDAYGNDVPVAWDAFAWEAPTTAGPTAILHDVDGIEARLVVEVVPGPLAFLALDGPSQVVAAQSAWFELLGRDAYGNAVALDPSGFAWRAPERAGPAQVRHWVNDVEATRDALVVPAALARIDVTGPGRVRAGDAATYAARGLDAYANVVQLASATFVWHAPRSAGPTEACMSESGVTGCVLVEVTPRISRIVVAVSSAITNVKRPVDVAAAAYDDEGALLPDVLFSWATSGGALASGTFTSEVPGVFSIDARAWDVAGRASVRVTRELALKIQMDPTDLKSALERGVHGNVTLAYADGAPVADARVTLTLTRVGAPVWRSERVETSTNATGRSAFVASLPSGLPGEYRISATVAISGNRGAAERTYHVDP